MVFEGSFIVLNNTVVFDPINRIWISRCFQPSRVCQTASSTIFYPWVWNMTLFIFENPHNLLQDGYIYISIHPYTYT